jgi:hypothetical protein
MQPPIILAASPYGTAGDELNDCRRSKLPRLMSGRKTLAYTPSDQRQCIRQPSEPARLAALAHVLPLRVVAVLQPAGSIAPDGLEVCGRVGGVEHVPIGRRYRQASEPPDDPRILNWPPVASDIGPTLAGTSAPDR